VAGDFRYQPGGSCEPNYPGLTPRTATHSSRAASRMSRAAFATREARPDDLRIAPPTQPSTVGGLTAGRSSGDPSLATALSRRNSRRPF